MRYGLPREESPKKKWKTAVEDELRCLRMEVFLLKDQLDAATKKLAEFTSSKPPDPLAFIRDFSRNENPLNHISKNITSRSSTCETIPSFLTDFNGNKNLRFVETSNVQSSQENPFASMISERPRYQSTWDYDSTTKKAVRYDSITCMPSYKDNKSFEELRFEDYVLKGIGFSNQIQRFKDSKLRSSRTERNHFSFTPKNGKPLERKKSEDFSKNPMGPFIIPWYITPKIPKAPWPFGPLSNISETSTSSVTDNITPDMSTKSNVEAKQNRCVPVFNFQSNAETKNGPENISSQILIELRKMGEKISSINDQLSNMDTNLSDVSSRVNVMDSRLSAVDMFVTMQRVDKKWQGLETRLAGLETPSPAKITSSLLNKDAIHSSENGNTQAENPTEKNQVDSYFLSVQKTEIKQVSELEVEKSNSNTPETSIKNDIGQLSAMDTSDMNLSDFVRSISCTDITMGSKSLHTSSLSDHSTVSDSSIKAKPGVSLIEMADLKSSPFPSQSSLIENSSILESKSIITHSGLGPSDYADVNTSVGIRNDEEETQENGLVMCNEITGVLEESKPVQEIGQPLKSIDIDNNRETVKNDPLGVTELKDSSSPGDSSMKEMENDADNGFVIIEKSDIEESVEENYHTKTCSSVEETLSNSGFKMYNDITEYLEINLGKKKNLVYEFGFEAKAEYSVESEMCSSNKNELVEPQKNKTDTPSADDSFQKFKTNFIENKSVDTKQSSPFVFFDSKTTEESSGKDCFGKN